MLNSSESELRALVNTLEHIENITQEDLDTLEYFTTYKFSYRLTTIPQDDKHTDYIRRIKKSSDVFEHWDFVDTLAEIDTILNRESIEPNYIFNIMILNPEFKDQLLMMYIIHPEYFKKVVNKHIIIESNTTLYSTLHHYKEKLLEIADSYLWVFGIDNMIYNYFE